MIYNFEKTKGKDLDPGARSLLWEDEITQRMIQGDLGNLIKSTHPIHNVTLLKVRKMIEYF